MDGFTLEFKLEATWPNRVWRPTAYGQELQTRVPFPLFPYTRPRTGQLCVRALRAALRQVLLQVLHMQPPSFRSEGQKSLQPLPRAAGPRAPGAKH